LPEILHVRFGEGQEENYIEIVPSFGSFPVENGIIFLRKQNRERRREYPECKTELGEHFRFGHIGEIMADGIDLYQDLFFFVLGKSEFFQNFRQAYIHAIGSFVDVFRIHFES
jgi:hypothetical protein